MEHLGLSSHNNCIVRSAWCLCDALLTKFLFLQGPGSKPAWAGGRTVAPNCSPGAEWIGMGTGGLSPAASCFLWGDCGCAHSYGSCSLTVLFTLYCRKTVLGDMRYKTTIKRFTSMDLLQPTGEANCISPEYFALAQRQLTVLAAPSVSATAVCWSLFSCIYPGSTQPMSLHF